MYKDNNNVLEYTKTGRQLQHIINYDGVENKENRNVWSRKMILNILLNT